MDKDFEKKVRMKRIRTAVIVILLLGIGTFLLFDTEVEKADYGDSLKDEIAKSQELYQQEKKNAGNEKGQYAPFTLRLFEQQIKAARTVSDDKDSVYNEEKEAYETLKVQRRDFSKAENRDVLSKEEVQKLIDEKATLTRESDFKGDQRISYKIEGKKLKKAVAINLTAHEEGPDYSRISEILADFSLQGQVVSLYQDGSFGGRIRVTAPMYSEKKVSAYAYRIDVKKANLTYVSDASVDPEAQTVSFSAEEGGNYVVLTKKMHKDAKKDEVDLKKSEQKAEKDNADSGKDGAPNGNGSGNSSSPSAKPESEKFDVTIEIRCDTLAEDLSKLEDPALKSYVPKDGTILGTTKVTVREGDTVFDVLNRVCRDRGIHVKSEYTPMYGSYYVQGINYLYEFDGGQGSGWMYKVNGRFPNYGCSSYKLKAGDQIVWCYTCDYGEDVGGGAAV